MAKTNDKTVAFYSTGESGTDAADNGALNVGEDVEAKEDNVSAEVETLGGETGPDAAGAVVGIWRRDAEALKKIYPQFDLKNEMKNAKFRHYLLGGDDIRTAYENLHRAEIMETYGRNAEKTAAVKIAGAVASGARFPRENALSASASGRTASGVAHFSKSDRDEIIRRAANGEKIVF